MLKRKGVVLILMIVLAAGCSPQSDITVIKNGLLFAGTGPEPVENGLVAFQGEEIIFAGSENDYEIPDGAKVLDADGGLIMPGVMDAHTHGTTNQTPMELEENWTRTGVTALRCMGVYNLRTQEDFDALKQRLQSEYVLPHILAAGPIITNQASGESGLYEVVADGEEARQVAQDLLDAGADFLKLIIDTEVNEPVREIIAALIDVAHQNGTWVTADLRQMSVIEAAVELGIDQLAHTPLGEMSDQLIADMVEKDIIMLSTLHVWQGLDVNDNYPGNIRRFLDAGGTLALGTDYGSRGSAPAGMPNSEFTAMKEHGISESQILLAATANAARALGLETRGTLEPGNIADIIVVEGNPLQDISTMDTLKYIVVHGQVLD